VRAVVRDAPNHPSPNAGVAEAAFAAALGLRLGGTNTYGGVADERPEIGDGRRAAAGDVDRAVRLSRDVGDAAMVLAVLLALLLAPAGPSDR
jgi:adenosylcobinamide-phosphate synthase